MIEARGTPPERDDTVLLIWTLYHQPADYPDKWVIRPSAVGAGRGVKPLGFVVLCDSEEEAFRWPWTRHLTWLDRNPGDDPVIVGTWI